MKNNHRAGKFKTFREKEGRGLRYKLEKILLIMQFKHYSFYKTFQAVLSYAEQQNIPVEGFYIQLKLMAILEEISLNPSSDSRIIITPELIEKSFQKLSAFIEAYQAALERAS